MKTIQVQVYEFIELPEKTRDKIRYELGADFGDHYTPRDECGSKILAPYIDKILGIYQENSQGPYWERETILDFFTKFVNENAGKLKEIINMKDDISLVEKCFLEDVHGFMLGMKWDRYDGLYNDSGTFYARNTLRGIWEYYDNVNTWVASDEYLQDFCQANDIFFGLNGRIINEC